ncbi:MAG TPA: HXXEE domain-containing protein, partial [Desulfobacterales bacterium]|nr:HXXEE domain-containing protein [Desulfobacterales bacterium]
EYFTGFPDWFSQLFEVDLSLYNFIFINSLGFTATIIIAILYSFNKINYFVIAVLGTLFFINGIIHIVATILTINYSPGTITGLLFYLPIGYLVYKNIFPLLPKKQKSLSVVLGLSVQIIVAMVAFSI